MNTDRNKLQLTVLALITLTLATVIAAVLLTRPLVAQVRKPRQTLVPTLVPPDATATTTQEPAPASASIGGRVWHDVCAVGGASSSGCVPSGAGGYQANGLLETGEAGLGGVLVQLGVGACPSSGLAAVTTRLDGTYTFTGLSAGTYCVSVDASRAENTLLLPGGWTFPAAGANNSFAGYTLAVSQSEQRLAINFGWDYQFLPLPEPVPTQTPQPEPTQTPSIPSPTSPQPSPGASCTDAATFVKDVTIPDNTRLSPGQSFIKTWRLRNSGTCAWTPDYALVFAGGDKLGGSAAVPFAGSVAAGETVDLSVTLTAPAANGPYQGKWQLRNADGRLFGIGRNADGPFWVKIVVGPPATATPAPPVITNWRGEYYANRDLSGNPALVRDDARAQL